MSEPQHIIDPGADPSHNAVKSGGVVIQSGSELPDALVADRPLFADASKERLVEQDDPDAAWQVAALAGMSVPGEWVDRLDLVTDANGVVVQKSSLEVKPAKAKPAGDTKIKKSAGANKSKG